MRPDVVVGEPTLVMGGPAIEGTHVSRRSIWERTGLLNRQRLARGPVRRGTTALPGDMAGLHGACGGGPAPARRWPNGSTSCGPSWTLAPGKRGISDAMQELILGPRILAVGKCGRPNSTPWARSLSSS